MPIIRNNKKTVISDSSQNKGAGFFPKCCDFLIKTSLFMALLGVPIFFTNFTLQGPAFEKQIYFYFWILLALVSWAGKSVIEGEIKIKRTPLDIPILIFFLVFIISTAFSVDRWHSFWGAFGDPSRGLASILILTATYYLVVSNFKIKQAKWLLGALILSNALYSAWLFSLVTSLKFFPEIFYQFFPPNLMPSFSGGVIFIALMMPLVITAILKVRESQFHLFYKISVWIFLFALSIINLFLILALNSFFYWMTWLALLCGMAVFLIFTISNIVKSSKKFWNWMPISIFVILMVFLMGGQSIVVSKINLPQEVAGLNYRVSWEIVKESFGERILLGSGPATYGYDFSLFRSADFNKEAFYNLRFFQGTGAFLESVPTIGIIGAFFLLLATISFVSVGIYLLNQAKEKEKIFSLGFFSSSLIFLISLFLLRMESAVILIGALVMIIFVALILEESETEEKIISLSVKASPKYALAFAFSFIVASAGAIFLFVFLGKVYAADIYAGSAGRDQKITEGTAQKTIKAINLYGKESKYHIQLAQIYMFLANEEALKEEKNRDLEKIQNYLSNSIAEALEGKKLSPKDVGAEESLAQIYENSSFYVPDSFSLSEESYKRALELEPHNPIFFLKIGQIKFNLAVAKKDDEKNQQELLREAKKMFQKSVEKKNDFMEGYFNLSLAEEALKNIDAAIENMQKAYQLNRKNVNFVFNLGRLYQLKGRDENIQIAESLFQSSLNLIPMDQKENRKIIEEKINSLKNESQPENIPEEGV
ncbi:MAG: hypothetical protein COU40_01095 [Candidatus Moranbacteria bacterium CG10_big_fil_rev_8_21_14_0_10_35_21]|nr:MAG: hypothetical protein COU40_01095 [Candidatus Moranbacteria bacterium CG10_big_fil_rev_8_21_14_0_10_35_21]PJA88542.1 MAG: hypothetical protein CO139_02575 [Candidatus Moranbacteria bacterium CG_4_9_14_3_um_filter_36_9]